MRCWFVNSACVIPDTQLLFKSYYVTLGHKTDGIYACVFDEQINARPVLTITRFQGPIFSQNAMCFALAKSEFLVKRNFQKTSVIITIGSCTYILIRLCKYVPCVILHIFGVYIYKISRLKLTSTRRDGGLFEQLECVQPITSRVYTIKRFKTKTNDRNYPWMKVGP